MAKTIEGLYYSESHEWLKVEGEYGYVGITDHAQQAMGNIVYVDMPEAGDEVEQGEDFGAVESVKAASVLISPVTGTVEEANDALDVEQELLNNDAYANWIIKVMLANADEVNSLMSAAEYEKYCETQE